MESDYAVELGSDDETLDFPWSTPDDNGPRYYNLKRNPDLLSHIEEAQREPQLAEFLKAVNSPATPLETAKCDTWSTTELNPEEDIFSATHKFGSYVDLLFSSAQRFSFEQHEHLARRLTQLLKQVPEIPASADFLIRRCYFGEDEGFYITFYLFGYGNHEQSAHQQWAIAMNLVGNALRQAIAP